MFLPSTHEHVHLTEVRGRDARGLSHGGWSEKREKRSRSVRSSGSSGRVQVLVGNCFRFFLSEKGQSRHAQEPPFTRSSSLAIRVVVSRPTLQVGRARVGWP